MNVKLDKDAILPTRAHATDAGLDLMTPIEICVPAHSYRFVNTGVHVELSANTRGHVCSKSGLNRWFGITADGTIDEGYTGSIGVTLHNDGDENVVFFRGDKIAQLVIEPVLYETVNLVDTLSDSERGDHGYGSTGR